MSIIANVEIKLIMENLKFRNLKASEIEVRPTDLQYKGKCSLLLYQNARCAMSILDDTVGSMNWSNKYEDVKGNLYCSIGIKDDDNTWVWKEDTGIESNFDASKGEASDAFKRAAVRWGIGRELYTTPKIKIDCPDSYYLNDKLTMTFKVSHIKYEDKTITELEIVDRFGKVVYSLNNSQNKAVSEPYSNQTIDCTKKTNREILKDFCGEKKKEKGVDIKELLRFYNFYELKCDRWSGEFKVEELYKKWYDGRKKVN